MTTASKNFHPESQLSAAQAPGANFDAILRSACQALESYDVDEFLTYLAHSAWQVITEKELRHAERQKRKDQKWLYLRKLLKEEPERIEQFVAVSQTFCANVHVDVNCALSSLSKAQLTMTKERYLPLNNYLKHSTTATSPQPQVPISTAISDQHSQQTTSNELWRERHPDSIPMDVEQPPDRSLSQVSPGTEGELLDRPEFEDAGYGTFQSTNQSTCDPFSDPALQLTPLRVTVPIRPYRVQNKKRHDVAYASVPPRQRQQPVQVVNHYHLYSAHPLTRPSLHTSGPHEQLEQHQATTSIHRVSPLSSDSEEEIERQAKMKMKKKVLEKCTEEVLQSMDVRTLLPSLIKHGLASSRDKEILTDKMTRTSDKILYFLDQLPRKGLDFLERFIQCLKEASDHLGHADLADHLERKYKKYCSRDRVNK